jgi:hypothetical protein
VVVIDGSDYRCENDALCDTDRTWRERVAVVRAHGGCRIGRNCQNSSIEDEIELAMVNSRTLFGECAVVARTVEARFESSPYALDADGDFFLVPRTPRCRPIIYSSRRAAIHRWNKDAMHTRDLIGHGPKSPHPHWPHAARGALNFAIRCEEGNELSVSGADAASEVRGSENDKAGTTRKTIQ